LGAGKVPPDEDHMVVSVRLDLTVIQQQLANLLVESFPFVIAGADHEGLLAGLMCTKIV
jgi:hypothetical protein